MDMDFPSNPTDGQTYGSYVYNASKGAWQAKPTSATVAINSPTAPLTGNAGDIWFNTNDGTMYNYYSDGTSTQWVESRAPITLDAYASPNYLINGGFDIWQRGTAAINGIASGTFHPDRWHAITDSVGTVNSSQVNIANQGIGSQYAWRLERTAGTNRWVGIQIAEGALSLVNKTVTLSLYLRKGSALTSDIGLHISTRAAKYGTMYDVTNYTVSNSSLSTSLFTRVSVQLQITALTSTNNADLFEIEIFANQAGAANAYFEIAGVQLELGSVATPFRRNANSIAGELAACQRYYYRVNASSTDTNYYRPATGVASSTTGQFLFNFPVTMRIAPYSIDSSAIGTWKIFQNNSTYTGTSLLSLGQNGLNASTVAMTATGQTSGQFCILEAAASQAGYIGFSAEL